MALTLPSGKRLAVNIGADFDAHSVWMGTFDAVSPGYLSRGEFGAEVGVPRLLRVLARHGIRTTWCVPTHSMLTFPGRFSEIVDAGHEIAGHGCWHEPITKLSESEERHLMEVALKHHERILGGRPRGYRSPAWDFSDHTLSLLEEYGFDWDSSLMGRDFEPYHPRPITVGYEEGSVFGAPSQILEFPVSWYLDDFPAVEFAPGAAFGSADDVFRRWKDSFDYAYANAPQGLITFTVHPQTIGRSHLIDRLDAFIEYMESHDGVWFAPLSEVYDAWSD